MSGLTLWRGVRTPQSRSVGQCLRKGPAALGNLRATRGRTIVPDVFTDIVPNVTTYSAAISACEKGQLHQQALRLLRAVQCHAIVPDVITCSAAISACGKGQQHQRALHLLKRCGAVPSCRIRLLMCCHQHARQVSSTSRHNISFVRGGTMPSGRMGSPTVLPSACATG